jgi:hypothetical protein
MRRLALPTAWLALCGQVGPIPQLERLRGLGGLDRFHETAHLRLSPSTDVRVVAATGTEAADRNAAGWYLAVQTRDATWLSREPIRRAVAVENEDPASRSQFVLLALEARDVLGGQGAEAVLLFDDGQTGGRMAQLVVCSVESATPRCTRPLPIAAATLDDVFVTRGAATSFDEDGAPNETQLVLR